MPLDNIELLKIPFNAHRKVTFTYTNLAGEAEVRKGFLLAIVFGTYPTWPEPQFFLRCYDTQKNDYRTFPTARLSQVHHG